LKNNQFLVSHGAKIQKNIECEYVFITYFIISQGCYYVFSWIETQIDVTLRSYLKFVDYEKETFGNSNDVFCDDVGSGTDLWLR
jgi:hypothetical protein